MRFAYFLNPFFQFICRLITRASTYIMDTESSNLTESDKLVVSKLSKVIRKQHAVARVQKSRFDAILTLYQGQISAFTKHHHQLLQNNPPNGEDARIQLKLADARKQVQQEYDTRISNLQSSISTLRDTVNKLEGDKLASDQALSRAREGTSQDATLILQLREEVRQLRGNKEQLVTESMQKHARNMQLLRESQDAGSKVSQYEESNEFLRSELKRLTTELVRARTQMDTLTASHDAALSAANQANVDLSNKLATTNARARKLTTDMASIERRVIDLQTDSEQEKADLNAQIDSLKKLVEMHREATKDAELHLNGYKELVRTLAQEKKEAEKRISEQRGALSVDKHAEVLLKDLNNALESKLKILENERHELMRARAAEARMATKQQALIREAETAKREAEEARRQVLVLEAQLATQKDSYAELRRNSMLTAQASGFKSPSVLPRTEDAGVSVPIHQPSFGYGEAMPTETPTPFRNAGRIGNAEQALAGVMEIRRRHEAILDGLREKRREYGELLNE